MFKGLSTVSQGSIGLAQAIASFTKLGYIVSVPLNDNQSYDLVVEQEGFLQRVQVKTTQQKLDSGNYYVELRKTRSNTKINKVYNFDSREFELLFVLTNSNEIYIIPVSDITTTTGITLGLKWAEYRLEG